MSGSGKEISVVNTLLEESSSPPIAPGSTGEPRACGDEHPR